MILFHKYGPRWSMRSWLNLFLLIKGSTSVQFLFSWYSAFGFQVSKFLKALGQVLFLHLNIEHNNEYFMFLYTVRSRCQSLFFNKVAGLWSTTLLKKRLWHRCFLVNFGKFLWAPFLQNTSSVCFCIVNTPVS